MFVASLNRDKKLEQKTKLRNIMVSKSDESASNCYGHGLGLCPSHIILRQTYVVVVVHFAFALQPHWLIVHEPPTSRDYDL